MKTPIKKTKRLKNYEIVVPLKYLSSFWRSLDIPLINCEGSLILTWAKNCVLTDITTQRVRNVNPNADPPVEARERIDASTNAAFKTKDIKLYASVVTLSTKDNNNFLEQSKSGFKRSINGINSDQKWLVRIKLTTWII